MAGESSKSSNRPPGPPGERTCPVLVPQGALLGQPDVPLDRPVTTVGSNENARLHLVSRTVSKGHAIFVNNGPSTYVADLASRTGVLVNGKLVKDADLKTGDRVQIGKFVFRFRSPSKSPRGPIPAAPPASVIVVGWPAMPVVSKVVQIGRRETSDIAFTEDAAVSAAHAVIFQMNAGWYIRDVGSRTGTTVNGKTIHQQQLNFGDRIVIGSSNILFQPGVVQEEESLEPEIEETPAVTSAAVDADLEEDLQTTASDSTPPPMPVDEDLPHANVDWKSAFPLPEMDHGKLLEADAIPLEEIAPEQIAGEEPAAEEAELEEVEPEEITPQEIAAEEPLVEEAELQAVEPEEITPQEIAAEEPLVEEAELQAVEPEEITPEEIAPEEIVAQALSAEEITEEPAAEPQGSLVAPDEVAEAPIEKLAVEEPPVAPVAELVVQAEPEVIELAPEPPVASQAAAVVPVGEPFDDSDVFLTFETEEAADSAEPAVAAADVGKAVEISASTESSGSAAGAPVETPAPTPQANLPVKEPITEGKTLPPVVEEPAPAPQAELPVEEPIAEEKTIPPVVEEPAPVAKVERPAAPSPAVSVIAPVVPDHLVAEVDDFVFVPEDESTDPNATPDVLFWGDPELDAVAEQALVPPPAAEPKSQPAAPVETPVDDLHEKPAPPEEPSAAVEDAKVDPTPAEEPTASNPVSPTIDDTHVDSALAEDPLAREAQAELTAEPADGIEPSESEPVDAATSEAEHDEPSSPVHDIFEPAVADSDSPVSESTSSNAPVLIGEIFDPAPKKVTVPDDVAALSQATVAAAPAYSDIAAARAAMSPIGDLASAMAEARQQLEFSEIQVQAEPPVEAEIEAAAIESEPQTIAVLVDSATADVAEDIAESTTAPATIEPVELLEEVRESPVDVEAEPTAAHDPAAREPVDLIESLPELVEPATTEPEIESDLSGISTVEELHDDVSTTVTERAVVDAEPIELDEWVEPQAVEDPESPIPVDELHDAPEVIEPVESLEPEVLESTEVSSAAEEIPVEDDSAIAPEAEPEIESLPEVDELQPLEPELETSGPEDVHVSEEFPSSEPVAAEPVAAEPVEELEFIEPEAETEAPADWSAVSTVGEIPVTPDVTQSEPTLEPEPTDDLEFLEFMDEPAAAEAPVIPAADAPAPPVDPTPPAAEPPGYPPAAKGKPTGPSLFGFDFEGGSFLGGMPLPLNVPPPKPGAAPPPAQAKSSQKSPPKSPVFDALASPLGGIGTMAGIPPGAVSLPPAAPALNRRPKAPPKPPASKPITAKPPAAKPGAPVPASLTGLVSEAEAPWAKTPVIPPTPKQAGQKGRPATPKRPLTTTFNLPGGPARTTEVFSQMAAPIGVEVFGGKPGNPDQFIVPDSKETAPEVVTKTDLAKSESLPYGSPISRKPRASRLPLLILLLLGMPVLIGEAAYHLMPVSHKIVGTIQFVGLNEKTDPSGAKSFLNTQESRLYSDEVREIAANIMRKQGKPPGFLDSRDVYVQTVDKQYLNWNERDHSLEFTYDTSDPELGVARVSAVLAALKQKDKDLQDAMDRAKAELDVSNARVAELNASNEKLLKQHEQLAEQAGSGPGATAIQQDDQDVIVLKQKLTDAHTLVASNSAFIEDLKKQDPSKPIDINNDPQLVQMQKDLQLLNDRITAMQSTGAVSATATPGSAPNVGTDISVNATTQPGTDNALVAELQKNADTLKRKLDNRRADLAAKAAIDPAERVVLRDREVENLTVNLTGLQSAEATAKSAYDAAVAKATRDHAADSAAARAEAQKQDVKQQMDNNNQARLTMRQDADEKQAILENCITVAGEPRVSAPVIQTDLRMPTFATVTSIVEILLVLMIWGELRRPKLIAGVRPPAAAPLVNPPARVIPWPQPHELEGLKDRPPVDAEGMLV